MSIEQAFGTPVAEALDHQQDSQGSTGRLGREPLVNAHRAIVPALESRPELSFSGSWDARYCHSAMSV